MRLLDIDRSWGLRARNRGEIEVLEGVHRLRLEILMAVHDRSKKNNINKKIFIYFFERYM